MEQTVMVRNGEVYINGDLLKLPKHYNNIHVTQKNGKVYVNGFEWTDNGWKRTLSAILNWVLC